MLLDKCACNLTLRKLLLADFRSRYPFSNNPIKTGTSLNNITEREGGRDGEKKVGRGTRAKLRGRGRRAKGRGRETGTGSTEEESERFTETEME